jgi:hypothetical protein
VLCRGLANRSVDELSIVIAPNILSGGKRLLFLFDGSSQRIALEHKALRQSRFCDVRRLPGAAVASARSYSAMHSPASGTAWGRWGWSAAAAREVGHSSRATFHTAMAEGGSTEISAIFSSAC